eukprot:TRINITY_DN5227_c0_g1_i1.p1 TRINITY_DN5227_c0_g1~~TRINITY_DN5227_c0_g1_i1.p1  ORF type:complete len:381 (+),score=78.82 TRINITY_DN5227_c0_g1_i1:31-1143(+)
MDGFACGVCGKWFWNDVSLEQHKEAKNHFKEDLGSKREVKKHLDQLEGGGVKKHLDDVGSKSGGGRKGKKMQCRYCEFSGAVQADVDGHVHLAHPFLYCNQCIFRSRVQDELDSHTEQYHTSWNCKLCGKAFNNERGLQAHTRAVHSYPCQYCEEVFGSEEEVIVHEEIQHGKFGCGYCENTFSTDKARVQHEKAAHQQVICEECNKSFRSQSALSNHRSAVHEKRGKVGRSWSLKIEDAPKYFQLPEDIKGHWVRREEWELPPPPQWLSLEKAKDRKEKSFGLFECGKCRSVWPSAHAWKVFHQDCIKCKRPVRPKFMWLNDPDQPRKRTEKIKKRHREELCEACRRGLRCQAQVEYEELVDRFSWLAF